MRIFWLKKISLIAVLAVVPLGMYIYYNTNKLIIYHHDKIPTNTSAVVISICMATCTSGMSRCALAQHKAFINAGIRSILICRDNTFISETAKKQALPIITCNPFRFSIGKFAWMPGIQAALHNLINEYGEDVAAIHCHYKRDVFVAKKIAAAHKIPVVLTHHTPGYLYTSVRKEADGIIAVSKSIAQYLKSLNEQDFIKRK